MKKKKRFKLVKKTMIATVTSAILINLLAAKNVEALTVPYSEEEQIKLEEFENNLKQLEVEEDIVFQNKELFNIVSSSIDEELNINNIKEIKTLTIEKELKDKNLSDLKYLTNLKYLSISNNRVNLKDLEYNQELCGVTFKDCTLYNTIYLPNSLEVIYLDESNIRDYTFIAPYNLKHLELRYTPISDLHFKNTESIKSLKILGSTFISAKELINCNNLTYLDLSYCINIKDSSYLPLIPNLKYISLSDYAAIWLDNETLSKLPLLLNNKESISNQIIELDEIALLLKDPSLTNDEQIKKITAYLLEKYEYDKSIYEEDGEYLITEYNIHPITNSLSSDKAICINYACMFQSLTNRLNLDTITVTNKEHAWNAVNHDGKYYGVDVTFLESEITTPEEFFNDNNAYESYNFNINNYEAQYIGSVYPQDEEELNQEIKYIKQNNKDLENILYNGLMYRLDNDLYEFKILLSVLALDTALIQLAKSKQPKKVLKKKNVK